MVVTHGFTERNGREKVVVIVFKRHRNRFADSLQPGKMNDAPDLIFFKDSVKRCPVTDIIFIENEILSRNLLDAFKRFFSGIDQIVNHDDSVTPVQKLDAGMAADKTGSSGDKNIHSFLLSVK